MIVQYHLSCRGLMSVPVGGWFCDDVCRGSAGFVKRYARNSSLTQGRIFELRPPDPLPSSPPLLYAVHNSHDLCGKYLFLAVHVQIYLNFIIFSCLLEWWVNMLGPEPLTIHWMSIATSLIGKWGITAHMWCMDGAKSICRVKRDSLEEAETQGGTGWMAWLA